LLVHRASGTHAASGWPYEQVLARYPLQSVIRDGNVGCCWRSLLVGRSVGRPCILERRRSTHLIKRAFNGATTELLLNRRIPSVLLAWPPYADSIVWPLITAAWRLRLAPLLLQAL